MDRDATVDYWSTLAGRGPSWRRIRRLLPFCQAILDRYNRRGTAAQREVLRRRLLVALDRQLDAALGSADPGGPWYPRGDLGPVSVSRPALREPEPEAVQVIDLRERRYLRAKRQPKPSRSVAQARARHLGDWRSKTPQVITDELAWTRRGGSR